MFFITLEDDLTRPIWNYPFFFSFSLGLYVIVIIQDLLSLPFISLLFQKIGGNGWILTQDT